MDTLLQSLGRLVERCEVELRGWSSVELCLGQLSLAILLKWSLEVRKRSFVVRFVLDEHRKGLSGCECILRIRNVLFWILKSMNDSGLVGLSNLSLASCSSRCSSGRSGFG